MVAQNVQNQGISALPSAYSGKVRNAVPGSTSFEELLQNTKSVTAGKAGDAGETQKTVASDTKKAETGAKGETVEGKAESRTEKKEKQPETVKTTDKVQTEDEKPETLKEVSDTELSERAAALVVQVLETVQELLDLTDEQIGSMLEELGMTEADLLNPDSLKAFYLNVKQVTDASALLTDASLLEGFQELNEAIEGLVEQSQIPRELLAEQLETPEFAEMLRNFKEDKAPVKEDAGFSKAEAAVVTVEETAKQPDSEKEVTLEFKAEGGAERTLEPSKTAKPEASETVQGEQFLQNLQEAVVQKVETVSEQVDIVAQVREIADQILERVRVIVSPETTSLEIQLTPEHLGKVGLTLSEQDGVLKARFFTENELAKQAIESNLVQFKETLNEQGLKVESIEVMVSEFSFDKNGQAEQSGQNGGQRSRHHFAAEETEEGIAKPDRLAEHFLAEGESTVNYMA